VIKFTIEKFHYHTRHLLKRRLLVLVALLLRETTKKTAVGAPCWRVERQILHSSTNCMITPTTDCSANSSDFQMTPSTHCFYHNYTLRRRAHTLQLPTHPTHLMDCSLYVLY